MQTLQPVFISSEGAAAEAAVMPFMLMGQVNISDLFPYRSIRDVTSGTSMEAVQKLMITIQNIVIFLTPVAGPLEDPPVLDRALRLGPRVLYKCQILAPLNLNLCRLFSLLLRPHFLMTSNRCHSEHLFHF